jgi:SAM-dependent methyltransferase
MKKQRSMSHGEGKEPFLEKFLATFRYSKTIRFLKRSLPQGMSVGLDAGCGYKGEFVRRVNAAIPHIHFYGCDISVLPGNADLFTCNLESINAITIKPDVVVMHAVLEHLDCPVQVLSNIHTLLPVGGYLIITIPSPRSKRVLEFLAYKLGVVSKTEIADHKHYWNKKTFLEMLGDLHGGLQLVQHRYFQFGMNNWIVVRKI